MRNEYLSTWDESKCFGCSACEKECPTKAITMKENKKGFRYPTLDDTLCIDCGRCREVCPWHRETEGIKIHTLYAAEHKSEDVIRKSQCAGVFTALSDCILSKGGVVYGAILTDTFEAVHARAETAEVRDKMRESKYVQSVIDKRLLEELEEDCKCKRYVLFTGTPCQCEMVKKNYGDNENLFVCDFICHGVPSPKVWKDYLKWREEELGTIRSARFRNKRYEGKGWHCESFFTEDGKEHDSNDYAAIFYSHLAHRESCFSCPFAKEKRYADITTGGFIDLRLLTYKPKYDLSKLFINTERGKRLMDYIKEDMHLIPCEIQYFKNQPCLYHPVERPKETDTFWDEYDTLSTKAVFDKYATDDIKRKYYLGAE